MRPFCYLASRLLRPRVVSFYPTNGQVVPEGRETDEPSNEKPRVHETVAYAADCRDDTDPKESPRRQAVW